MLILVPLLVLWISKSKSIFAENWHTKYLEDADSYFEWKLEHTHTLTQLKDANSYFLEALVFSSFKPKSLGYWFLFWDLFFEIPNVNPFLRQIWFEKVEFSILPGSASCSYIFTVAKSKNWSNQQKNVG